MNTTTKIIGAIIATTFIVVGLQVYAQGSSLWRPNANNLQPVNTSWGVQVPSISGEDCIGTDANGVFQSGTCSGGGGGSSLWATSTNESAIYPLSSRAVVVGDTATSSDGIFEVNGDSTLEGNLNVMGSTTAEGLRLATSSADNDIVYSHSSVGGFTNGFINPTTGGGIGIGNADNVFLLNDENYTSYIYMSTDPGIQIESNVNSGVQFTTADRKFIFGPYTGTDEGILDFSNIASSDKTFTFPNASGTVALTDDLYTSSDFDTDFAANDTDDLSEGTTNLYSQWEETGSDIYYDSGNVGIGTSSPSEDLDILDETDNALARVISNSGFGGSVVHSTNFGGAAGLIAGGNANFLFNELDNFFIQAQPLENVLSGTGTAGGPVFGINGSTGHVAIGRENNAGDVRLHIKGDSSNTGTNLIELDDSSDVLQFSVTDNGDGVFEGALDSTTLNTGQGDNELYAMDQDVQTSDSPTFSGLTLSSLTNCDTIDTDGSGVLSCGTDAGAGGGLTSLNGETGDTQTFATSTSVDTFTIDSSSNTHTFTIPSNLGFFTNDSGYITDYTVTEADVTQHEGAIDHDALTNFVANEHIDWTADQGATDINDANIAETAVTQHESALTITESQISDLNHTTDTNLTEEEVQDFAWNTLGGTQTLIDVTYQDGTDDVDFVVDNDLSNYDNSTSGFITDANDSVDGSELDNLFSQNGFLERTGANTYQATSTIDISDDTNLSGDSEIVLTDDALSIDSSIARDTELHDEVTLSGTPDYITLSGQDIVRGTIDFGDITASDIILESEGIASNDNDTTIPTSAAVKDYADTNDSDTTYTAGGTLLDLSGTTFSVNEGVLTDGNFCTFTSAGSQLDCNISGSLDDDDLSDNDTDDLSEGTNLYYTDERSTDATGGMVTGNTESLISVVFQDGDNTLDFTVEPNLSNYTNDAGFLTGNETITLSGDVSGSGTTSITTSLGTDSVSDNEIDYSNVTLSDLTFDVGSVSKTEFGYLDGVTSAIQTQLDNLISALVDDTSPQLGGDLDKNGNRTLVDDSPDTDESTDGKIINATVDANSAGTSSLMYIATDGNYESADATSTTTMPVRGIVLSAGTGTKEILLEGHYRQDGWNWTPGQTVYMSETVGEMTQTPPSTSGAQIQAVGYAVSADVIYFDPSLDVFTRS